MTIEERLTTFCYHTVDADGQKHMADIRRAYHDLAELVLCDLPECRSKSLAVTYLEDSLMRAVQAIAITEGEKQNIGV